MLNRPSSTSCLDTEDCAANEIPPVPEEPSLSWDCRFCLNNVRIYPAGRRGLADHCTHCAVCRYLTVDAEGRWKIAALIDEHL